MPQQHHQIDDIGREQHEDSVGTYIYEEIISPNSLLRSDRFARSKPIVVAGPGEETARVLKQQNGRENRANNSSSGECLVIRSRRIDAPNTTQRRDIAATSRDLGFNNARKRGKAPAKGRPTTAGTTSKVCTVGQQRNGQQNGEKHRPISETTAPPQRKAFQIDSAAQSQKFRRKQSCGSSLADSGITERRHGPTLSQSPLRAASAPFTTISSGHFQQSPMRARPANKRVSPERMTMKVAELEPSSQMETWSTRCCDLTQQIVEHLRRWNQPFSDGPISTSAIKTGAH